MINKRILMTGASGFLGSYVHHELVKLGATVYTFRRNEYDLRKQNEVENLFKSFGNPPDYIFHLAATVGGIQVTSKSPATSFYDNMMMGLNLLEAIRTCAPKTKLIFSGSVCAYPKHTPVPMVEQNLWIGEPEESNGAYGIAKRAMHTAMNAYRQEHNIHGVYALLTNLYGPTDDFNPSTSHVIPALIRKFVYARQEGDGSVEIWGDGTASRDFLYVEDAAKALILLAENYDSGDPVNIGSGEEIPISSLANLIRVLTEYEGKIAWDKTKPNGQPRRCLSIARAKHEIDWKPETTLLQGLSRTIKWWYKVKDKYDA